MSVLAPPRAEQAAPPGYVAYQSHDLHHRQPRVARRLLRAAGSLSLVAAVAVAGPYDDEWGNVGYILQTPLIGLWFLLPILSGVAFFLAAHSWPQRRPHAALGIVAVALLPALAFRLHGLRKSGWSPIADFRDTQPTIWLMTLALAVSLGLAVVALHVDRSAERGHDVVGRSVLLVGIIVAAIVANQWGTSWTNLWEESWTSWVAGVSFEFPLGLAALFAARPSRDRLWFVAGATCAAFVHRAGWIGWSVFAGLYEFDFRDLFFLASPAACCVALRLLRTSTVDDSSVEQEQRLFADDSESAMSTHSTPTSLASWPPPKM